MVKNVTESSDTTSQTDNRFTGLRRFNLIMGFLHFVQGTS
jgi:hypothetical protein